MVQFGNGSNLISNRAELKQTHMCVNEGQLLW